MQRNKKPSNDSDKIYQSYAFSQDKNAVVHELTAIKEKYDNKTRGQKKLTIKDIAIKLLTYAKQLGELEISQQAQALSIYPDLNTRPTVEDMGLELSDFYYQSKWPIRLSNRLIQQTKHFAEDELIGYMSVIRMLSDGRWPGPSGRSSCLRVTLVPFGVEVPYNQFFLVVVPQYKIYDLKLLYSVGVERISQGEQHKYKQYLKIWAAPDNSQLNDLGIERLIKGFWEETSNDIALSGFETDITIILHPQKEKKGNPRIPLTILDFKKFESNAINQVQPIAFMNSPHIEKMSFDRTSMRWIGQSKMVQIQKLRQRQAITEMNSQIIRKVVDFKSVQQLIEMMVKIPGFRIKCSEEEKAVIGHNGSLIVMGRSGTGKTTCAVLRLFTVQMLFYIRQSLCKENDNIQLRDTRPGVDKNIGLHSIFATASPCLARQIERYYKEFALQIKKQTAKRKGSNIVDETNQEHSKAQVDIKAIRNNMYKLRSMGQINQNQYPAFMTTRQLLFLIDGTLDIPFFDSKPSEEAVQAHYGRMQTTVKISNTEEKFNIPHRANNPIREKLQMKSAQPSQSQQTSESILFYSEESHQNSFKKKVKLEMNDFIEVTYELFATHFWPKIRNTPYGKVLTPQIVWTQIISNIKGSMNSYIYPNYAEPKQVYIERSKSSLISDKNRESVYEVYCMYEQWKRQIRAYDLMDSINYVLARVMKKGYTGPPIHYLMIDQVQDLPYVFILLLTTIVETGMFFSGDSAQTIAKGVEFKFSDIKRMFDKRFAEHKFKLDAPNIMQLSINFRSHNAILQLSNSIVSIIEVLFPTSIDRLRKQRSDYDGPKPVLLTGDCIEELVDFMECTTSYKDYASKLGGQSQRSKLQFGFYKAILVRDAQSKKNLPEQLQEFICLTIHEAKGLEFYDVMLYNFFDETRIPQQWKILRWIKTHSYNMRRQQFEEMFSKIASIDEHDTKTAQSDASHIIEGDTVILSKLCQETGLTKQELCDVKQLCSELKMLYTAVTRTRNNLLIYDEIGQNRKPIEKIWYLLNVIHTEKDSWKKNEEEIRQPNQVEISKEEWRQQGMIMLNRNLMQEAIKCFKKSGDYGLLTKAEAKSLADQAAKQHAQGEAQLGHLETSNLYAKMPRNEKRQRQKELNYLIKVACKKFRKAASKYLEVKEYADAGRCYFTIGDHQQALQCFSKLAQPDYKSIGHCYFKLEMYVDAAACFLRCNDAYVQCLQSLDMVQEYEAALGVIHKYHNKMSVADKINLLDYFVEKALDKIERTYIEYEKNKRLQQDIKDLKSIQQQDSQMMDSLSVSEIAFNDNVNDFDEVSNDLQIQKSQQQQEPQKTQEELKAQEQWEKLLQALRSQRIQVGRLSHQPEKTRERIINILSLKSKHIALQEHDSYKSVEHLLDATQQTKASIEEEQYTNEEIALGELEFRNRNLLCIVLCKHQEKLFRRIAYYGLSWIYETLALPIFCENLISEKESREAELEKLNKNSLAIDSILSNIYDYIIDEGVTEQIRQYYVQGLILMGMHRQALRIVSIPVIIELCYTNFDVEELLNILDSFLSSEEKQHYSSIEYNEGDSMINIMKIERLLWNAVDTIQLREAPVLMKCSFNSKLDYKLPEEIVYGGIYYKIDDVTDDLWQDYLSTCINTLPAIVHNESMFHGYQVYDMVTFSLFIAHYPKKKPDLMKSLTTTQFVKYFSCMQRIANEILTPSTKNFHNWKVLESVLSFYRLRLVRRDKPSQEHDFLGDECIYMHISSPILNKLLEHRKKMIQQKKDNFVEYMYFVDSELAIISVPIEPVLIIVKQQILEQTQKCGRLFCSNPSGNIASYQNHLEIQYKNILRHYLKITHDAKFEREQLYELLPFNKNKDMPSLLKNHLLSLSRLVKKQKYYALQQYNECTMLIASGQQNLYREIYPKSKRCQLYWVLNEKYYNDLDIFEFEFRSFVQNRYLTAQHLLPLLEELMIFLLEKYLLKHENFYIFKIRLYASQLIYLKQLQWNEKDGYTCIEKYFVETIPKPIHIQINQYFSFLTRLLTYKFHGLNQIQLSRVKHLVFIYIINLNYAGFYGASMFYKHMKLLECCKVNPYILQKIRALIISKKYSSSNELVRLIQQHSEQVYLVEFTDRSNWKNNSDQYNKNINQEKKEYNKRSDAAIKIQKWWRQIKLNEFQFYQDKKAQKSVFGDQWKSNAFYSVRRAIPFPNSDFLKRCAFNSNSIILSLRQCLSTKGTAERSSHIFHSSMIELRKLATIRNAFSELVKEKYPYKQLKFDVLYEQLEQVEEAIERSILKSKKLTTEKKNSQNAIRTSNRSMKFKLQKEIK